jgi:two-component system CheB/CheR fusion protein
VLIPGLGTDGLHGLRQIQSEGGLSLALASPDDDQELRWDSIAPGYAAPTFSATRIVAELRCWREQLAQQTPADPELREGVCERMLRAYGLDFLSHKASIVRSQVAERMLKRAIDRLEGYFSLLDDSPQELAALRDSLLVGSTRFFRDDPLFERLQQRLFPTIFAPVDDGPIRIWVPGCSTGEEAYTIAMATTEYLEARGDRRKVRIFASDVREQAICFARGAVYPLQIAQELSPARLARFFVRRKDGYEVVRSLRETVMWVRHDVLRDPPFARVDLLSCRNLLVYFDRPAQARALARFHFALKPDGALLLGSAESTVAAEALFLTRDAAQRVFRKRSEARRLRSFGGPHLRAPSAKSGSHVRSRT